MTIDKIEATIKKFDPLGLIKNGAPEGEYDLEIASIANNLHSGQTVREIKEIVDRVFREFFDEKLNDQLLDSIATEIFRSSEGKDN